MPIDYKKYPSNWKTEIVPQVKTRDNNCCAFCGVKNYSVGMRHVVTSDFILSKSFEDFKEASIYKNDLNKRFKTKSYIVIVLTVAHLNHDIKDNNLSNLKALCQKCHLDYDKEHHKKNSRQTLKNKKGIVELSFPE